MSITRIGEDGGSVGIDTLVGKDFNPAKYGTTYLHLAASAPSGLGVALPSDNDDLATWVDLSGNGRDFVQESSYNVPKWRSGVQSGQPALEFDGATSTRRLIYSGTITLEQPFSVTAVGKTDATNSTFLALGTGNLACYDRSSTWRISAGYTYNPGVASDTSWHVMSFKVNAGANSKIYKDGAALGSPGDCNYTTPSAAARVGIYGTSYPMDGYIAEIILWTSITDESRLAAERALGAKYGITVA